MPGSITTTATIYCISKIHLIFAKIFNRSTLIRRFSARPGCTLANGHFAINADDRSLTLNNNAETLICSHFQQFYFLGPFALTFPLTLFGTVAPGLNYTSQPEQKQTMRRPGSCIITLKLKTMKKIFTLAVATVFSTLLFAAAPRPTVTLNNSRNYEVVIDGRSFYGSMDDIQLMAIGKSIHTVKVYELKKGLFIKSRRLLDSETFRMAGNSMTITIDRAGQINVREQKFQAPFYQHGKKDQKQWNDKNDRNGHGKKF